MVNKDSSGRNRSEGWSWAKLSGHLNELKLAKLLENEELFGRTIGKRIFGRDVGAPIFVEGGGSSAKKVSDIFGNSTNGKPDIYATWRGFSPVRFSIKKSESGQVFLTSVDRFVAGFEHHFSESVPKQVSQMLHLFIGTDSTTCDLVMQGRDYLGPKHNDGDLLEIHQKRLVAVTLEEHFPRDWAATMLWSQQNSGKIADLCFSKGYAKSSADFATHVWYFVADSNSVKVDQIIPIPDIVKHSNQSPNLVKRGRKNGGSTISFPFGFLQMHAPKGKNQVQFHHRFKDLKTLGN